jgi:hypothetical protein
VFKKLKKAFITELTLATFNSKQDIVLEYNFLGYAVGGVLS